MTGFWKVYNFLQMVKCLDEPLENYLASCIVKHINSAASLKICSPGLKLHRRWCDIMTLCVFYVNVMTNVFSGRLWNEILSSTTHSYFCFSYRGAFYRWRPVINRRMQSTIGHQDLTLFSVKFLTQFMFGNKENCPLWSMWNKCSLFVGQITYMQRRNFIWRPHAGI